MKILAFLINSIYWLVLFILPAIILGLVALWLYVNDKINLWLSITIASTGIGFGIILAEYIRKRFGLNNFWSRLSSTPDMDKSSIIDKENNE